MLDVYPALLDIEVEDCVVVVDPTICRDFMINLGRLGAAGEALGAAFDHGARVAGAAVGRVGANPPLADESLT